MILQKKILLYVFGLCFLFTGCQTIPATIEKITETSVRDSDKTMTPQQPIEISQSSTPTEPSPILTPTSDKPFITPTLIPTIETFQDFGGQLLLFDGQSVFVFENVEDGITDLDHLLGFGTLPEGYLGTGKNYNVSPNGYYLAYHRIVFDKQHKITDESLAVFDYHFNLIANIPWNNDWHQVQRWLSNEWLLITTDEETKEPRDTGSNRMIINPFLNERRVLSGPAPDFLDPCYGFPEWDPTLIYSYVPIITETSQIQHVIWDTRAQRIVARLDTDQECPDGLQWSQSQKQIVIAVDANFFKIGFDGNIEKFLPQSNFIYKFSVSPDEQKIAYFFRKEINLDFDAPPIEYLAILNLDTDETLVYADEFVMWDYQQASEYNYPSWSLNNKYIAVKRWVDEKTSEIWIIDSQIGERIATLSTSTDFDILGWMKSP